MNYNNIETIDELSPMQQAMLFHSLMAPGSGVYVLQMSLRLTGRLDLPGFERAWRFLVARHSILRTAFFWEDLETPRQVAFREVDLTVERTCWCGLVAAEQEERLAAFLVADRVRGFELGEAPLLRLALFELAEDVHQLVWTQHHLVTDGWSQGLVLQELLQTYAAFVAGREPVLPPAPVFHDYLTWLQRQDLGAAEVFWRRSLEGFSTPTFLAAREGRVEEPDGAPGPPGIDARRRDLALPAAVSAALRAVARRRRLTLNTLAQGAWALLLAQESSREDVVFGVTVAGRPADLPGAETIVGPFLDTLPLRVEVAPGRRLQDWLFALQEYQVEARRYEHAPLVDVQRWSGLPAGVPLFDHILVFENLLLPPETARPAGLLIEEGAGSSLTNYPLDVVVVPGNELLLSLRWDATRCGAPEMVRLLERLARVLTSFADVDAETGDSRLGEVPLLLAGERHQLLCEWNDTADVQRPDLLHQLFAAQAETRPDALAAVWEGNACTYRELAERAHRLAAWLRRLGVDRGTAVGVWMERSLDMLSGVLGILEAGGAYVPLDAAWPADRVETILARTGAPVILCGRATLPAVERLRWRLPRLRDAVCLDVETPEPEPEPLDTAAIRSLFDFVADRATDRNDRIDRALAGGFVSRRTGLPFLEAEVDEYRDRVLSLAAPWLRPGARILEVGCGSGLILWEMARRVESIVGIDPSERTQESNREHARSLSGKGGIDNVELPTGFAHEIGERFAPGSFDLVLLASTVQFFPGPRYLEKVVADALALLAPGGALLLADVIDARKDAAANTLALDEELFHDLGRAEIHHRTAGFANELGERYDVILQRGETKRRKRTWTGWHVDRSPASPLPVVGSPEGSPEDIAYIIHTSGSTGLPKGIAVQHAAAVNLIHWVNRTLGIGPADRLLFVTSLAFDLSVWDIFGMLAAGGTVHVAAESALREPAELVRLLRTEPITLWDSAPAALQQLAPLFSEGVAGAAKAARPLRLAMLSGDWIPVPLPDQVRAAFPGCRVISLGGATEATVWSNWYPLDPTKTVDPRWPSIPYGRPIANARYHALDAEMRPCPIGVPGDLYIGGTCLCVGYAGQPELTAAAFLPDPFSGEPGEPGARLYSTGDRVRFFADGNLEFLGRVDRQVKLHGYRIELGEIEVALLRHERVREAVVQVLEDRLVAWIVPNRGPGTEIAPGAQDLRAWLAESLPSYMVPSAFVVLAALPVTANGKLDREALPAPERQISGEGWLAPRTPAEEILAGIWAELLDLSAGDRVGAADSFFDLGGHSLLATRLVSAIRGAFGVDFSMRLVFEHPTVEKMARAILEAGEAGAPEEDPPIVPLPRTMGENRFPVSFSQLREWILDRLEPGNPAYNIPSPLRIEGPLDVPVLIAALQELVRRHEVFRTRFVTGSEEPLQVIVPEVCLETPVIDLSALPDERRDSELRRQTRDEAATGFDLATAPLLRTRIVRLAPTDHALLLTVHHIIADGWSLGILHRELAALYDATALPPLPQLPIQYADFAVWQRRRLSGEVLERQVGYWRQQLAGAPAHLALPTDRPRPPMRSSRGGTLPFLLPQPLAGRLGELARRSGATLYMVLLAGFQALLARWSGEDEVVAGTYSGNRPRRELEGLIGFFINTLVLRTSLAEDPAFTELLGRVRETTLGAYAHADVPFEKLLETLVIARDPSRTPLFQALLVLHNFPPTQVELKTGARLSGLGVASEKADYDLELWLGEAPQGITGSLVYSTALFDETTVARFAAQLQTLLEAAMADPERNVWTLPLIAQGEQTQQLQAWSRGPDVPVGEPLLHRLIAEQAVRTPDAVALEAGGFSLTYAGLAKRASRRARHLRAQGIGPGAIVALKAERTPDLIVSMLAVLQAGAAYLPLDPAYPQERREYMVADSGAVEEKDIKDCKDIKDIKNSKDSDLLSFGSLQSFMSFDLPPEVAAYVLYTSGSTGLPKGVVVPHRAIASFVRGARESYGLSPGDRVLQLASLSFDTSAEEIWPALAAGATLVLRPEEMTASIPHFLREVARLGITVLDLPTAFWHELVAGLAAEDLALPRDLRLVILGGEEALADRFAVWWGRAGSAIRLVNTYGPTETTIVATRRDLADLAPGGAVPIGRPIPGARAVVLDRFFTLVPAGLRGELWIGGAGVSRGYLGRPDLTAERFAPDPFSSGEPGARLYRTGDLAVLRPDGDLVFAGRADRQLKIRGYRIEPGEIEAALRLHPAVHDAVADARSVGDFLHLTAWIVTREGSAIPAASDLRAFLRERLPDSMVPAAFVTLAALPLTPNGKVDRKALPAPEGQSAESEYVAPRTPVEEVLAGIWGELLGLDRVGAGSHFFELGGHSLLATRVLSRLRSAFGIEIPLRDLFEAPVLSDLAARIETAQRTLSAGDLPPAPPLTPVPREGLLPLSFSQQRLWFIDLLEPGSPLYNIPIALGVTGPLDAGALALCLGEIVRRHESLRTVFAARDGAPEQVIRPAAPFALPLVDLSGLPESRREVLALRLAEEEAGRPFDLTRDPLLRGVLLRLGEDDHVVALTMHHIASDAWSVGILVREVTMLYAAFAAGLPSSLPELPVQYADFAVWQHSWLHGEVLEGEIAFWRRQLAGLPPLLELPTDRPRPAVQSYRGATRPVRLPAALTRQTAALARREGATLYMVLLAGFQALLGRTSGQDDFAVGSPVAGRNRVETEELIGFFVNTLVLRGDLSGMPTFRELLGRARETALAAHLHQDVPFEKLVQELSPERSLAQAPLFQVMFVLQNAPVESLEIRDLRLRPVAGAGTTAKFDLTLSLWEQGGTLAGAVEYATDLFDAVTVERLLGRFERLLDVALATPDRPVAALPLLGAGERQQLLVEWSDTAVAPAPEAACLHELFAAQARATPEAVALVAGSEEVLYRDLDQAAERLAARLRACGAGPEVIVGVCLDRSAGLVTALLAILKAGAAYLPLDLRQPRPRLAAMLEGARASIVLSTASLAAGLPWSGPLVLMDQEDPADVVSGRSLDRATPESLAYVLFTSGSTGTPKGVAVTHRSAVELVRWAGGVFGREELAGVLAATSLSFDLSVFELFVPLCHGGTVILAQNVLELPSLPARERVTLVNTVPSAMAELVRSGSLGASIRTVNLAGEPLPRTLVDRLYATGTVERVWNLYGPSEDTTYSTASLVAREGTEAPGIGGPVTATKAYVLAAGGGMEAQPVGVAGELYIGGAGLARGYLHRPDLTAERFVPDPWPASPTSPTSAGARLYRTGDLVRWRPDGSLDYLGRLDHQVKIRGFRIELGEIEAVLSALPGVREAVVMVREDRAGGRGLVAYVAGDAAPDVLREQLRERLPDYMVPAAFMMLAVLPLTPNGKLDRKALPALAPVSSGLPPLPPDTGRGALEEAVAGIWCEVLDVPRVGSEENFFDLGGHSLLLPRVQARLRDRLGREVSLVELLTHTTVRSLTRYLEPALVAAEPVLRAAGAPRLAGAGAVAIVGLTGRFPGAAGIEPFWANLRDGVSSIARLSDEELAATGIAAELRHHPRYVPAAGVLDDVELFDAGFFGYSPREAELLDPQQRMFLECAWEAMEDAGYDSRRTPGPVGVFASLGFNRYLHQILTAVDPAEVGSFQLLLSSDKDFLATRVSYKLDLSGPSMTVQTACSSSLVAVHLACQNLLLGACDMALAGGVSINLPQRSGYLYEEGSIASPDGFCRTFDAAARGTVSGSGAGAVVLKRLEDALADGDTIHAVLLGSAITNDGGSGKAGFAAPSIAGQAAAISAALAAAGVSADSIGYVEAHGTATPLGDPIEVAALTQAFRRETGRTGFCLLGSVKTNLGHLDAAAGVTGLIKTVLALEHRQIPPSLHFTAPNPAIDFAASPFRVADRLTAWEAKMEHLAALG